MYKTVCLVNVKEFMESIVTIKQNTWVAETTCLDHFPPIPSPSHHLRSAVSLKRDAEIQGFSFKYKLKPTVNGV